MKKLLDSQGDSFVKVTSTFSVLRSVSSRTYPLLSLTHSPAAALGSGLTSRYVTPSSRTFVVEGPRLVLGSMAPPVLQYPTRNVLRHFNGVSTNVDRSIPRSNPTTCPIPF